MILTTQKHKNVNAGDAKQGGTAVSKLAYENKIEREIKKNKVVDECGATLQIVARAKFVSFQT
jgi:hypothetical protein